MVEDKPTAEPRRDWTKQQIQQMNIKEIRKIMSQECQYYGDEDEHAALLLHLQELSLVDKLVFIDYFN